MHQDPYLKKLADEQKKILKQLLAGETDKHQTKPPVKYPKIDISGAGMKQNVNGLFVPEGMVDTWGQIDVDALTKKVMPGNWSMDYGDCIKDSNVISNMKEMKAALFMGYPVHIGTDWSDPDYGQFSYQHNLLRAHHGRKYEYVWSPVLKAHVRIGESLKPKRG